VSRKALAAAGAAVLGIAALGALALLRGGDEADAAEPASATASARVDRRDLVLRTDVEGTLGYGTSRSVPAAGHGGTVTWLPQQGAVVRRGETLFAVDGRGVRLLDGATPLWRKLGAGASDGDDVRQLERNLVALGHDPNGMDVDDDFDSDTAAAVRDWQEAIGVAETGAVEPGQAVFLPGARRVQSLETEVGALVQPGLALLQTTGTEPLVTIDLDARNRSLARRGASVTVELPSGRPARGRIADVGTVAESAASATGEETAPTVSVTVRLTGNAARDGLDGAPVTVSLEQDRARNVLAVPVEALLALRGGGYAVELIGANGTRTLTAVEAGTFADGWVEVRGRGIRKGVRVAIAA
jgi:peptidoglycan hydrolase-like protein with peptidoglycan-binding domain